MSDAVALGLVAIVQTIVSAILGVIVAWATRRIVRSEVAHVATDEKLSEVHQLVNNRSDLQVAKIDSLQDEVASLKVGRRTADQAVELPDQPPGNHD